MALRNSSGTNAIPRLVVKIIGGKHVRYFTEEPEKQDEDKASQGPGPDVGADRMKEAMTKQTVQPDSRLTGSQAAVDPALQAALDRAPNRLCVTAPSGDRSLSYIHPRNPLLMSSEPKVTIRDSNSIEQGDLMEEDKAWLSQAISEELCDWQVSFLNAIEEELAALDPFLSGTLNQSQVTNVFLKNEVPLKLSSFHLLLKNFSNVNDQNVVHYPGLLQFIQSVVFHKELHEPEAGHVSPLSGVPWGSKPPSVDPAESETRLQRFQRLERAMQMCDTQKTGYMDKDKAMRLIQNYNLIFDLKLSSLKINEATSGARSQSRVHLASALRSLKQL